MPHLWAIKGTWILQLEEGRVGGKYNWTKDITVKIKITEDETNYPQSKMESNRH